VSRYNAGETIDSLARSFGNSFSSMKENLHRWGASVRRRGPARTYALNEKFFETIDSEAKAYWLGFLLADGAVLRYGAGNFVCRVELALVDRPHLRKFTLDLGYEGPLVDQPERGKYGSCYVAVASGKMCRDLIALGCVPKKTGAHGTPAIRDDLRHHMYRGYFDGDGCLSRSAGKNNWKLSFVGAPAFIEDLHEWTCARLGLAPCALFKPRKSKAVLVYGRSGNVVIERMIGCLYSGATVMLERKLQTVRLFLETRRLSHG